ncbi:MAG: NADH-quinone oxidoreductase subunit NuoH [Clostridia bacterium]|nr:NADH-quinone oxidoreductase subunit NuoH [Clostridia bacterium]
MNYLYFLYIEFLAKYNIPQIFGDVTFYIIPCLIIFVVLLLVILALVLFERKLLAWFTQRKGPNRVGFWGVLQTVADALKLLCKENITPIGADRFLFNLAPILIFIPVMIVLGLIPFSSEFTFMNFQTNLLIYVIVATMPVLSILLAGWASNNKYSLMGAMRNVSQILAYELPIAFTILSVMVLASSMNLTQITLAQSSKFGALGWFGLPCIIGFVTMFICTLAELNRCPFDLPEAESELICGYNTEYSGMRFALFYLSEYGMLFANSLLLSILFLGGFLSPLGKYLTSGFWIYFEQVFWLLAKSFFLIFIMIWVRATLPRLASFDLLKFSWVVLLPVSIFNMFLMVIVKYLGVWG